MRLLLVFIKEALPGQVLPALANSESAVEAARIHEALVTVLLRQLSTLENTRLRFVYAPDDADEALRFSLLPRMGDRFEPQGECFVLPGESGKPTLEIDFRAQEDGSLGERLERAFAAGFAEGFEKIAAIGPNCPAAGARWIHAAFARLGKTAELVIGPAPDADCHLLALSKPVPELFHELKHRQGSWDLFTSRAAAAGIRTAIIPPLPIVKDAATWEEARQGPFGPALRKILEPGASAPPDELFD